jgi:hypothetical protein
MAILKENLSIEGARNKFLATVQGIVNNDRNKSYGSAEDSFQTIADFWSTYLYTRFGFTADITVYDVACMMDLMKSARIASNPTHMDSWVDKAGYAACAGGILEQAKEESDKPFPTIIFTKFAMNKNGIWYDFISPIALTENRIKDFATASNLYAMLTPDGAMWSSESGWRYVLE